MLKLININPTPGLNNEVEIPCVGCDTFRTPADVAEQVVKETIETGHRHIDTAAIHGNEGAVGRGVKNSGIKHEDPLVTSKLQNTNRGYEQTEKVSQKTLDRLQMDYLDLYLTYWSINEKQFGDDATEISAET